MDRYICIHGHFYQPPRENPWLETVEIQDSAHPYHDWNERITAECYAPNTASRILDGEGWITRIVNNYSRISFNFGPTLLTWLEQQAPDVYRAILEADRESQKNFSGHGSALAQAYNHIILPLANQQDKHTQVLWGIRDFEHRFGRKPEGMWLPETAADLETLDIMAGMGIRFTILAPFQAARARRMGGRAWRVVSGGHIDPRVPYELRLPSGRKMCVFFYDGPLSNAVAFEGLLTKGEYFAQRLTSAFIDGYDSPQLVHIATDGETYGHHHPHGDMALAYALHHIESSNLARITNYGEYLDLHPPTHEVEIIEDSSWSCIHGIERWRNDCGCNSGMHGEWRQGWRGPLREAMDWVRDTLAPRFKKKAGSLVTAPWEARDDYIGVILDRSPENVEAFLAKHASRDLTEEERVTLLKLMELQRHTMLMYTSCGWFFDELSGIETVQVMQYAGRAVQLAQEIFGDGIEGSFVARLELAKSNIPEYQDGGVIYHKFVKPAILDLKKVCAHYAVSSLFEEYAEAAGVYCYAVERQDYGVSQTGSAKLATSAAKVTCGLTGESATLTFGVLQFGDHNINAAVRPFQGWDAYHAFVGEAAAPFARADFAEVIRVMDRHFGESTYSLRSLFRDEQRKVLNLILESTITEAEAVNRQVYEHHAPFMRFLVDLGAPLPKPFLAASELVIDSSLRRALESEDPDPQNIKAILDEAKVWNLPLDGADLGHTITKTVDRLFWRFQDQPADLGLLQRLDGILGLVNSLPFEVDLWRAQNIFYSMLDSIYSWFTKTVLVNDEDARAWAGAFASVSEKLRVRVSDMGMKEDGSFLTVAGMAQELVARRRIPCATYRLQFNRHFTFRDAQALVPYLNDLGITDCYTSPLLKARPESIHGYDICDHTRLNPDLGSDADFDAFTSTLKIHGMGLILDMVPNHMAIAEGCNTWWTDILENGPSSIYARYFDIDLHPAKQELENKVLLAILEDQYGRVLEEGKFRVACEDGAFFIHYYEHKLPVAPRSFSRLLNHALDGLIKKLGQGNRHLLELQSILTAIGHLPLRTDVTPEKIEERNREKEVIKRRIADLCNASPEVRDAVDDAVRAFNGTAGDPRSFDLLDSLIDEQAYRLAFWRVATDEINYRRFFDINELAAIRVELPEVFQATHHLILRLLADGRVTGLRIDHPDGLWDPSAYFYALQKQYVLDYAHARVGQGLVEATERAVESWLASQVDRRRSAASSWPLYVLAEKVLVEDESLPQEWPIYGSTGYDFLNAVNALFVDARNRNAFDSIYGNFTGARMNFRNLANSTKKMIMLVSMASEVNAISHQLERIAEKNRRYRDFTLNSLTFAIREVIASLPVYRTYVTGAMGAPTGRDRAHIEAAVADARRRNPRTARAIFDFIRETLLMTNIQDFCEEDRQGVTEFIMKFQQVTGPVMAKGVEDTAFYIYNRLVSLNEVGGNPAQFGISMPAFHRKNAQNIWPHSLLATSTHDTKRGEDVRARLNVLSEMPKAWQASVNRWRRLNARKKSTVDGERAPDRNDEYLLYQTLVGAWPMDPMSPEEFDGFRDRIIAYMLKATREAKVHTSWVNPHGEYDEAVRQFVLGVLADGDNDLFVNDLKSFQSKISYYGQFNSLSQLLLKLTCPGVPDIYQGNELWDFSLVDPDNRRPVDYEKRRSMLSQLKERAEQAGQDLTGLATELLKDSQDGRIKLFLSYRTLAFRRENCDLFSTGAYLPIDVAGEKADHVCAFMRVLGDRAILVVAPRLMVGVTGGVERPPVGDGVWGDTRLVIPRDQGEWSCRNLFTSEVLSADTPGGGGSVLLREALAHFPVALLERIRPRLAS